MAWNFKVLLSQDGQWLPGMIYCSQMLLGKFLFFVHPSKRMKLGGCLYLVSLIEFKFVSARIFRFFGAGDFSGAVGFCCPAP